MVHYWANLFIHSFYCIKPHWDHRDRIGTASNLPGTRCNVLFVLSWGRLGLGLGLGIWILRVRARDTVTHRDHRDRIKTISNLSQTACNVSCVYLRVRIRVRNTET
jgi:hypothetical protein